MNSFDIAHRRLYTQHIARPACRNPADVVSRLGAVQAQDYLGALWAIGLRMQAATEGGVEQAIADRAIARTWPMRGTLHFVPAADIRWMLALLAPRVVTRSASRYQQLGLDDATFARSRDIFQRALEGGKQLTRQAMYQELEAVQISTAGQRGIHILSRLAHEGLLCFGARAGKQPTFVLLDEWLPEARALERDDALAELARRYFTGHGPATVSDLRWWSGLTAREVRAGLDIVKSELVREEVDGQTYWMAPDAPPDGGDAPSAFLLPGFDEFFVGYRDRSAVLDPARSTSINPGNNGMLSPAIVVDGRVAGTWTRAIKKNAVLVTLHPFTTLGDAERDAVAAAAERYGRFLGMPVSVS